MREAEYDRMLEAVKMAIEPAPQDDYLVQPDLFEERPLAANDNQRNWPLMPFPEGWYATC